MKKIYSFLLLLAANLTLNSFAQNPNASDKCAIQRVGLEVLNVTPSNGGCVATANVFFAAQMTSNAAQAYFTAHIWERASYPNLPYSPVSNTPTANDLRDVLRTVVIMRDNSAMGWRLADRYGNIVLNNTGITLKAYTVPGNATGLFEAFGNYVFFEISGVSVTTKAACDNIDLAIDIWGSNSPQNNTVNCVNKAVTVFGCKPGDRPSITGIINCNAPVSYSLTFGNPGGCNPYIIEYNVFADINNNGVRDASDPLVNNGDFDGDNERDNYQVVFPGQSVVTRLRPVANLQRNVLFVEAVSTTFGGPAGTLTETYERITIDNGCAVLPVKFKSFNATRNNSNKQQVDLAWETAQEQNNKGFFVQRKTEGEWKDLAFVFSAAPEGNSSNTKRYTFKDQNGFNGVSQYRLLQVDLDGKASYSDIRALGGLKQTASVMVYPNPATGGKVNLLFADAGNREVLVSDLSGRIVKQYREVANNLLTIEGLAKGFYTLKVTDHKTGSVSVEKVVVK